MACNTVSLGTNPILDARAEYKLSFSFHSVPTPPPLLRIPPPPPPTCMYRQAHREKAMNKHANEESTILFLKTLIL